MIEFRPLNHLSIHLDRLIKGRLWFKVIIGLFLGAGIGVLLNPSTGLLSESINESTSNISIKKYQEVVGSGLKAELEGEAYKLGNWDFVNTEGEKLTDTVDATQIFVSKNARILGRFKIENKYREGIKELVAYLKERFRFSILTGDNTTEEKRLIELFGNTATYKFKQTPQDKLDYVIDLQRQNENVLMIGDGLNEV